MFKYRFFLSRCRYLWAAAQLVRTNAEPSLMSDVAMIWIGPDHPTKYPRAMEIHLASGLTRASNLYQER